MAVQKNIKVNVNKIKSAMALKGDKQIDLAEALGIAKSTLNGKLMGKRNFTLNDLYLIARRYDAELVYFLES